MALFCIHCRTIFKMGSDKIQTQMQVKSRCLQHEIVLSEYYIQRYLVTVTQYWFFRGTSGP